MAENSLSLLTDLVGALTKAGIRTWLFGGWAEELFGVRPPGPHRDIDLLYPAEDFRPLDKFLRARGDVEEVRAKRFSHKRAFQWQGVLVEVLLVRREGAGLVTSFFDAYQFLWPPDALSGIVRLPSGECGAASPAALRLYRERHREVEQAHQGHAVRSCD